MRVRRISTYSEAVAESALRRALANTPYVVTLQTSLQSVLDNDARDLTGPEFSLYTRGQFDFVVFRADDHLPEFAVEFDAFGHDRPRQIERDIIKNRLCARAGFPLLRIGVDESRQLEQVTILEWLVRAFVDFEGTVDALDDELDMDDDDDDDLGLEAGDLPDPDLSESASDYVLGEDGPAFDEEHPLPANASIAGRLLRRFGIDVGSQVEGYEGGSGSAPYVLDAGWPGRQPDRFEVGHASEFVVNERDVRVLRRSLPSRPVFECVGRARFAWALKTALDRPPTSHPESREEFNRRLSPLGLDWLDPLGAARQLALYDALSQVERWAAATLAGPRKTRGN